MKINKLIVLITTSVIAHSLPEKEYSSWTSKLKLDARAPFSYQSGTLYDRDLFATHRQSLNRRSFSNVILGPRSPAHSPKATSSGPNSPQRTQPDRQTESIGGSPQRTDASRTGSPGSRVTHRPVDTTRTRIEIPGEHGPGSVRGNIDRSPITDQTSRTQPEIGQARSQRPIGAPTVALAFATDQTSPTQHETSQARPRRPVSALTVALARQRQEVQLRPQSRLSDPHRNPPLSPIRTSPRPTRGVEQQRWHSAPAQEIGRLSDAPRHANPSPGPSKSAWSEDERSV